MDKVFPKNKSNFIRWSIFLCLVLAFPIAAHGSLNTDYIKLTITYNHPPTAFASDLSGLDDLWSGLTATFTAKYSDPNGASDLDKLYIKIDHPTANDIEYYAVEGADASGLTPTAVSGSEYITSISYDRDTENPTANDIIITWNIKTNWTWDDSANIEFGVKAIDDSAADSGWDITTTADKTYESDLDFSGTLACSGSVQGSLTSGDWVQGGETLSWSGLTVVYEGSDVSPDDADFDIRINDDDTDAGNDYWDQTTGAVLSFDSTADAATDTEDIHNIDIINIPAGGNDVSDETWTVKVDVDDPSSTITAICDVGENACTAAGAQASPPETYQVDSIAGAASDTPAGINKVEISLKDTTDDKYWDGDSWESGAEIWLDAIGTTAWSYNSSGITFAINHTYLIHSKATDNATNIESSPQEYTFKFVNSPPTVAITTSPVSQSSTGLVSVSYNLSDIESPSTAVYLFYETEATLNAGINDSVVSLTLSSGAGANFPSSGTIMIEEEWIEYTSKSDDILSGLTRGVNTTAIAHTSGKTVWLKANNATGDISSNFSQKITCGTGKSIIWTPKDDINGFYSATSQIRVSANDGASGSMIGNDDSNDYVLDTKDPDLGTPPISVNASQTPASLTISASDNTNLQMKVGLASDLSGTSWESYAASKTISLATDPETVYIQFKDAKGNTTSVTNAITPEKPINVMIQDITNLPINEFRLFIAWKVIENPTYNFKKYHILRSTDDVNYTEVGTSTSRLVNYYTDNTVTQNTLYYYKITSEDNNNSISYLSDSVKGKANGTQDEEEGGGGGDTIVPAIIFDLATGVTDITSSSATIKWKANELSDSTVGYSTNTSYAYEQGVPSMIAFGAWHSITLVGLEKNTTYHFRIRSRDPSGNLGTKQDDVNYVFATEAGPDVTPPVISKVKASDISHDSAKITWTTNELSDSTVGYSKDKSYSKEQGNPELVTSHAVTLSGLSSKTTYNFRVRSQDALENTSDWSSGHKFKTSKDTIGPVISDIISYPAKDFVTITWTTGELATSQVEYGTSSECGSKTDLDPTLNVHQVAVISGLTQNTTYHFRIISKDESGNETIGKDSTFTTLKEKECPVCEECPECPECKECEKCPTCKEEIEEKEKEIKEKEKAEEKEKAFSELIDLLSKILEIIKGVSLEISLNALEEGLESVPISLEDISSIIPGPILAGYPKIEVTSNSATISWASDKESSSLVAYVKDADYSLEKDDPYLLVTGNPEERVKTHQVIIYDLEAEAEYHFQLCSKASLGPLAKSRDFTFTTKEEIPQIKEHFIKDITEKSATFVWTTNVPTDSQVKYIPYRDGKAILAEAKTQGKPEVTIYHEVELVDLTPGETYVIELSGRSLKRDLVTKSLPPFSTTEDVTPPLISQVRADTAISPKGDRVQTIISWFTDEPSTSQVFYQPGVSYDPKMITSTALDPSLTKKHVVVITIFKPGTVYLFRVESNDVAENKTTSRDFTILTPQRSQTIIQIILQNLEKTFGWMKRLGVKM